MSNALSTRWFFWIFFLQKDYYKNQGFEKLIYGILFLKTCKSFSRCNYHISSLKNGKKVRLSFNFYKWSTSMKKKQNDLFHWHILCRKVVQMYNKSISYINSKFLVWKNFYHLCTLHIAIYLYSAYKVA